MSEARGFVGEGDIYIERFVAGVSQGLAGPYFAKKFEVKPNSDKKELVSKGRGTYGQVLESVTLPKPTGFTLELNEVNRESLTMALLGTASTFTQLAGSLTDQAVTVKLDRWVPVTKQNLTGAPVVKHTSGLPIYVQDVDYSINPQLGLIKAIVGGAIVDAASVKVTSTYGAISSTMISGVTNGDIRAKLIFDGRNYVDKLPCIVTVWEAIISADSAFDFLGSDFNSVNLPGTMKTPIGKSEPFTVELRNAA
jgi:hypothetical protein